MCAGAPRGYTLPVTEPDTRARILDAATAEFAAVGLAGARVDRIAQLAGCNKQLIYHYFGDKNGLFEAVMTHVMSDRPPEVIGGHADLAEHFARKCDEFDKKRTWTRLLMWEALANGDGPVVAEERRRAFVNHAVRSAERAQEEGHLDAGFLPRFLVLAIFSLMAVPFVLPQIARLITGVSPYDPAFRKPWLDTVSRLLRRLGPEAPQ